MIPHPHSRSKATKKAAAGQRGRKHTSDTIYKKASLFRVKNQRFIYDVAR